MLTKYVILNVKFFHIKVLFLFINIYFRLPQSSMMVYYFYNITLCNCFKTILIAVYLCRVHLPFANRESKVHRPTARRPTGYVPQSVLLSDEDDDEENMDEEKKLVKRLATGYTRKQDILEDNVEKEEGEEERGESEEEKDEEKETDRKELSKRRATGYNREQYVSIVDEDDDEEKDREPELQKKAPVFKRRGTPYVSRTAIADDDDDEESSVDLVDINISMKKKTALFVADEDLQIIRIVSKPSLNRADFDSDEAQ